MCQLYLLFRERIDIETLCGGEEEREENEITKAEPPSIFLVIQLLYNFP